MLHSVRGTFWNQLLWHWHCGTLVLVDAGGGMHMRALCHRRSFMHACASSAPPITRRGIPAAIARCAERASAGWVCAGGRVDRARRHVSG